MKKLILAFVLLFSASVCDAETLLFNLQRISAWKLNGAILDSSNGTLPVIGGSLAFDGFRIAQSFSTATPSGVVTVAMGATFTGFDGVTLTYRQDNGLVGKSVLIHGGFPLVLFSVSAAGSEVDQWTLVASSPLAQKSQEGVVFDNPEGVAMSDIQSVLDFIEKSGH